jgi:hypothetical protein
MGRSGASDVDCSGAATTAVLSFSSFALGFGVNELELSSRRATEAGVVASETFAGVVWSVEVETVTSDETLGSTV